MLYILGILSIIWKQFLKEKFTDMSSQFHDANQQNITKNQ